MSDYSAQSLRSNPHPDLLYVEFVDAIYACYIPKHAHCKKNMNKPQCVKILWIAPEELVAGEECPGSLLKLLLLMSKHK